ncbi:MAG: DUF2275 domain-containing protein [Syntrophales bacterium]
MTCKEIENNLPAYLEDALSPREKAFVDEHLASCAQCSNALEDLKKTARLVREMKEVETPPWFTQKIMARVREEAKEKDGFFRKFFYPLHVKIPIQVLGTVLIAVIAFQIYRFGELETKVSVSPPASVLKTEKDQDRAAAAKPAETAPSRAKKEDRKQEKTKDMRVASVPLTARSEQVKQAEVRIQKEEAPPTEMPAVAAEKEESTSEKDAEMIRRPAPVKREKTAAKTLAAPTLESKDQEPGYRANAIKESKNYAAPAAQQLSVAAVSRVERIGAVVHVADAGTAAEEVGKLLGKFDARNIRKEFREESVTLTAELKPDNAADFLQRLKGVGKMEEQGALPGTRGEQYIPITIELRK